MKKKILAYAQARYRTHEIAKSLGITEYDIWHVLVDADYDFDPQTGRIWKPPDERRILRLLKQGQSVNRIAHDLRVGNDTVNRIRRQAITRGVKLPARKSPRRGTPRPLC